MRPRFSRKALPSDHQTYITSPSDASHASSAARACDACDASSPHWRGQLRIPDRPAEVARQRISWQGGLRLLDVLAHRALLESQKRRAGAFAASVRRTVPRRQHRAAGIATGNFVGAAWVYSRSGDVWTQQGDKLVGPAVGRAYQGFSVSMSGDGNTAIVGGPTDNDLVGAAWIYITSAGRVPGTSWAASWSAPVRLDPPDKACPWPCPPAATPPSWAGGSDRGGIGAAWVFAATSSAPGGR